MNALYFEDYRPGTVFEGGPVVVDEQELLDFARRFDPQAMHVDAEAAKQGPFGGLIASGWHTAALMMRLLAEHFLSSVAGLASPGLDELRWVRPVRPGDRLRLRVTVTDAARSRSKPDRGIVRSDVELFNQHDEVVLTLKPINLVRCRPVAS